MDILIHGVFDATTLKTLKSLNVTSVGFDLRGKSLNLIPFHVLKSLIPHLNFHRHYLIFENDKSTTIESFLSLLGADRNKFELEFRDSLPASFYSALNHPFTWFFNPEADWVNILRLPQLQMLVLPVKYQETYQSIPELWRLIEARDMKVSLHAESFSELELYVQDRTLNLSVDLGKEMEVGFRQVDQFRLMNLSIWRTTYEIASGQ